MRAATLILLALLLTASAAHCADPPPDPKIYRAQQAIEQNKTGELTELLAAGLDVNARTSTGHSLLQAAVLDQNMGAAQLLIDHGADVNLQDFDGRSALMYAAERGSLELAQLLLDHGASIALRDQDGYYAMHFAVFGPGMDRHDAVPVLRLLLDHGADVNSGLGEMDTPLHRSVFYCTPDAWQLLLDRGAQIDAENVYHLTPLHFACANGVTDAREWLVAHGAKVDDLYLAASTDDLGKLVELISEGRQDINMYDWRGESVLDWASNNRAWKAVALLEALGAKSGSEIVKAKETTATP